jgi:DNA gyrase/topoisomerase IV subunit B
LESFVEIVCVVFICFDGRGIFCFLSADCTLIVTEGDSAKTLAVCGLSVVGRDYFGVFPLRGKPLNVRGAKPADLIK